MSKFRLLIVEDDDRDLAVCKDAVEVFKDEKQIEVELIVCKDLSGAQLELNNAIEKPINGAIIDIKLGNDSDAGNQVIRKIQEEFFRIPTAVLTGTPGSEDQNATLIGVFTKGEPGSAYTDLLNRLVRIHNTGLTDILGNRGLIESSLTRVFRENLLPQTESWAKYAERDPSRTRKALLRHTLNHLIQLVDEDTGPCFPEEFYLHPPPGKDIRTGSILKEKESDKRFVVMSPECDLVVRDNGKRNTDRILIVEVFPANTLLDWFENSGTQGLSHKKKDELKNALENKKSNYYHCLPETGFSPLEFLNFRSLNVVGEAEIKERFNTPPNLQISPPFVKDILARLSSYYARQDQPDVDFHNLIGS